MLAKGTRQTPGFLVWQRGQGNFELAANYDYIHAGRLTRAKVCVGVGSQSLPSAPTKCCRTRKPGVCRCFFAWGRLWLRAEGVGWYGKMNDTVIYGTMYQVRKQMGGGLHKVCYDGAGDDAG